MSKYLSSKFSSLVPYTPGEQPRDMKYVKLNTNELPFKPSVHTIEYANNELDKLQLYSDPTCSSLHKAIASYYGVKETEVLSTNGSDEILNFAFMAFCDKNTPAAFADITYGFYKVFAEFNNVPYDIIPLKDDFSIDYKDYLGINKTIFIANPNAPTGLILSVSEIEEIVKSNKNNVVVIDEAYIDFGGESAISLIHKYDNLLVTRTFSKSRALAGGRLGFGIGCESLINDINTIKYSTNPYNVNRMTMAAGVGAMEDDEYMKNNVKIINENKKYTLSELSKLGFEYTDSYANFIFVKNDKISGKELYLELKKRGVLVRHFDSERIKEYNRITIGTLDQMKTLIEKTKEILGV